MIENHTQHSNRKIIAIVVVAALGYFVDIYDLVLFGVIKAESLKQIMIGTSPALQAATGKFLFNMQMIGMLIGGLFGVCWAIKGTTSSFIWIHTTLLFSKYSQCIC